MYYLRSEKWCLSAVPSLSHIQTSCPFDRSPEGKQVKSSQYFEYVSSKKAMVQDHVTKGLYAVQSDLNTNSPKSTELFGSPGISSCHGTRSN